MAERPTAPSGLPTRGGSAAASVPPAVSPISTSTRTTGPDGDLPRRSVATGAASVASATAPAASDESGTAPRSGMFSSFRSRRAVESEVGAVSPVEPTSLEALAHDLPEFVPTLETSTPALPHRELSADAEATEGLTQDVPAEDGATVLDPISVADEADAGECSSPAWSTMRRR